MDREIKVPRDLKAKLMLWSDISYHEMEYIDHIQSVPDLESALSRMLRVDFTEPRRSVLLELYTQTVLFCRERGFKKEQTSALVSIIKSIHEANMETPIYNFEQCHKYCKDLLICHSIRRPPFSLNIFSFSEANIILQYIHNNYLRHYKLYKYIFAPQVKLNLSLAYSGMEGPVPSDEASVAEGNTALSGSSEKQVTSTPQQDDASDGVVLKAA